MEKVRNKPKFKTEYENGKKKKHRKSSRKKLKERKLKGRRIWKRKKRKSDSSNGKKTSREQL